MISKTLKFNLEIELCEDEDSQKIPYLTAERISRIITNGLNDYSYNYKIIKVEIK